MHSNAGGTKISFGGAFDTRQFFCLLGCFGQCVRGHKGLHQPFANFRHLRGLLGSLLESGDSFSGSAQPDFRIAQFAAQYGIVSGEPDGFAVGGAGVQQPAQVMERVSAKMFAQRAAALIGCARV